MRVLDACAAPGGKSFAAAVQMRDQGCMISCDIHENKWKRIRSGAERLGMTCISTRTMDACSPDADLIGAMDVVLADVPCSGLGVIRKKPEIRFKDPAELARLPAIQRDILTGLAPCVKPGGVLVYSTCTVLARENEDVVRDFLHTHPEFSAEAFSLPLPGADTADGMFTFWPQEHGTDGFFVCKLRRHE
jgi:16S rRNA (cytosine967-C5)-methyltransferase